MTVSLAVNNAPRPYNIFRGSHLNEVMAQAFAEANRNGFRKPSRNGESVSLRNAVFVLDEPQNRHLHLKGRKSNIFQMVAETFWVMAGRKDVKGYLEFFLPRAPNYSDNGTDWHGAYGPRIYAYEQLQTVVDLLVADPDTRRAVVMIADIGMDNKHAIETAYGKGHVPKDIPCNRELHFNIYGGRLSLKVIQRSGDLLFGTGSINPFEFSFLQELVLEMLVARGMDVKLGEYIWDVTDAHYYTEFQEQVDAVVENRPEDVFYKSVNKNPVHLGTAFKDANEVIGFFSSVVHQIDMLIKMVASGDYQDAHYKNFKKSIADTIEKYGVNPKGQLANYIQAVGAYVLAKIAPEVSEPELFTNLPMDNNFARAMVESGFRKFEIGFIVKE